MEASSTISRRDGAVAFAGLQMPAILDEQDAWQAAALKAPTRHQA